jgi:hypothetical protein
MTMFRVMWIQSALDDLMTLWINANSATRVEINRAALNIDQQLAADPTAESESRDPGEWVFFCDPLGVLMEIDIPNRTVWVLTVWRYF